MFTPTTQCTATVIDGMFKPDDAMPFPDATRVKLTIEAVGERRSPAEAWESFKARALARPVHSGGKRFTRDELNERS